MSEWYVYLVRAGNGSLYTGITTDVERRLGEHEAGGNRGAKFFRGKGPLALVFQHCVGPRSLALKAEAAIKKMKKTEKEHLVQGGVKLESILAGLAEDEVQD
ncbi:GIY-YIG nuclease family protein [Nitrospina watsonii]|nr:GIY-YIG nuclease family protein [Nitrospina watsonii]